MIEFKYKLPSMDIEGKHNGLYNNPEMVLPCMLTTESPRLGLFLHTLHNEIHDERSLVFIDGKVLTCCKNWIRDHVHIMKGFKHWEYDLKSYLEFTLQNQHEKGYFYELIKQIDDAHWSYVDKDHYVIYPEDNLAFTRLELENDIEYILVEGVMQYYKATGDFEFVKKYLPNLEKGINYVTSDKKRFSKEYGLCIRPYTIDTWDFTYDTASQTDRRIHENEKMCAMHGDNSGVYQAMSQLAFFNEKLGNNEKASEWRSRAQTLKNNMFKHLWNGKFFRHQLCINGDEVDDFENVRLSLSNPYDINRGVTDLEQSRSIIEEYIKRRETTDLFAEWFTIDPPYKKFMFFEEWQYVNGAVSPFTAGELAKAAFNNGYEEYGYDILERFIDLAKRDNGISFLYKAKKPKTGEKIEQVSETSGAGPSAWGAAALLSAFDEALAGVVDKDCLYREIDFSPRLVLCNYGEMRYITGYEISHKFVDVRFVANDIGLRYDVYSEAQKINAHILLPKGKTCSKLFVNGKETAFKISEVAQSIYVDVSVKGEKHVSFEAIY